MFAKVHPAEDVKSGNTGSCHDLVRYLEKETGEGHVGSHQGYSKDNLFLLR